MSPSVLWVWGILAFALVCSAAGAVFGWGETYGLRPKEADSVPASMIAGEGAPQAPPVNPVGALYLDSANSAVYYWDKSNNIWVQTAVFGGVRGASWYTEETAPPNTGPATARPGDYWLQSPQGVVYRASYNNDEEIVWSTVTSIKGGTTGNDTSGHKWFHGEVSPNSVAGAAIVQGARVGDLYFDAEDDTIYRLGSTEWNVVSATPGAKGDAGDDSADGARWYVYEDVDAFDGAVFAVGNEPREGDFALVLNPARAMHRWSAAGAGGWVAQTQFVGSTWLHGTAAPGAGDGKEGDMFVLYNKDAGNPVNNWLEVQRKTGGAWARIGQRIVASQLPGAADALGVAPLLASGSGDSAFLSNAGVNLRYVEGGSPVSTSLPADGGSMLPGKDPFLIAGETAEATTRMPKGHTAVLWWAGDNGEDWNFYTTFARGYENHRDTLGRTDVGGTTTITLPQRLAAQITYLLVVHSCDVGDLVVRVQEPNAASNTLVVNFVGEGTGGTGLRVEGVLNRPAGTFLRTRASGPLAAHAIFDCNRSWNVVPLQVGPDVGIMRTWYTA